MSEEEKKAIERFSKAFEYLNVWNKELIVVPEDKKYFLTVLNLLEKKDKIIDLMGEKIFEEGIVWENKEDVKKHYERKVENGN